eukprot:6184789-Amphidinium_carterae.2
MHQDALMHNHYHTDISTTPMTVYDYLKASVLANRPPFYVTVADACHDGKQTVTGTPVIHIPARHIELIQRALKLADREALVPVPMLGALETNAAVPLLSPTIRFEEAHDDADNLPQPLATSSSSHLAKAQRTPTSASATLRGDEEPASSAARVWRDLSTCISMREETTP